MGKIINHSDLPPIDFEKIEIVEFYTKVAKNVQRIRLEKGISQLELSYMIGFKSTSLISGAEAGYNNIKFSLEHLYKIAKALQVNIKDFFD
jgi:putative transcriptional regulator